ncbi:Aldehyde dehydrogenase [Euzebya pacifica]|uniref:Aldehyde dehydrogenase n=1 Tax=Euzebya pacifica TaxID=1608957 RepID=A0A346XWY2_9ACTN|nr:aldehyde dehydrogenase family protein [Euzebya pacifica]AXV06729.1 Aldehyde dehydrogenase [Euzebya pacifica]
MEPIEVRSPANGTLLARVDRDDESSVSRKVEATARAQKQWAALSPMDRAERLLAVAADTSAELEQLVVALVQEQGKTRKEARMELKRYVGPFIQYAGMATGADGQHVDLGGGVEGLVKRRPVGVVAGIVPWNFPASLFGTKLAPALAAGCGFVVKPAESTSVITRELADIVSRHVPEGLVQVVVGGAEVGDALVRHPSVARIAFTGSTAVGKRVGAASGGELKRVSLELGGCDPFVVLDAVDVRATTRALMGTRFYNAGQVCVAPKRLIAHEAVADELIDALTDRLERIVVGDGLEEGTTMGPLHTQAGREHLEQQIEDAVNRGATLVGGGRPDDRATEKGWFLRPALLLDPQPGARVRQEETFGPVLSVVRVSDEAEAIAVANETPYGLGASVWGTDHGAALRVADAMDAGYVWVNTLGRVYDELPFGGVKQSGFGREHGRDALLSYTEARTVVQRVPTR